MAQQKDWEDLWMVDRRGHHKTDPTQEQKGSKSRERWHLQEKEGKVPPTDRPRSREAEGLTTPCC